MNQELWRRAEELFHAALGQSPEARRSFLDEACGEDAELRRQVEVLVSKDEQAGSLLEKPVLSDLAATLAAGSSLVGRQIGPYRILSLLGAGGMGAVYRAHDSKLGRDVAIKTLPPEFARDPDRLARFRREARTLASLNHPNIAAIYGLEESGEVDCLVLELVEGDTLRGPLPIAAALDRACQVAEALEAAHKRGIIHRDLKPANVKVTPQGRVKVLDFGLAKAVWSEEKPDRPSPAAPPGVDSSTGRVVGTPGYMSPEQARGEKVDQRTDVWAFGCLLYELLTGKRAFAGETASETLAAVLEREPEWQNLPAKTPAKIRELLRHCLQRDPDRRLTHVADAHRAIEEAPSGRNRWRVGPIAATALVIIATVTALWLRRPIRLPDRSQWVQLTKFPDPVSQPALSPDGRMLAFIRGNSTFTGRGQIYLKMLPDGETKQLTQDDYGKMSPAFSPDGTRIAYTAISRGAWDTWVVPVLGGEPQPWLKNASGLVWTGPRHLLFSEIKTGAHMGIVAADENRMHAHDVYLPAHQPGMAHRSYLSPDSKWVLLVEMNDEHAWIRCRVVPADGSSTGRPVGPPGGGCTSGAWSPDGRGIYLTSNAGGQNHIWRQRFPGGQPEQFTLGPTEEEGIAIAPDGRSLITAVALPNASLWVHDPGGERQIFVEGNAVDPRFTPDGKRLLFRIVKEAPDEAIFYRNGGEVRIADMRSGRSESLLPGTAVLDYDLSMDGQQVVMEIADSDRKPRLWIFPLDRSSAPMQIQNVEGNEPRFGPSGEVFFLGRGDSGNPAETSEFVYRVRSDGTGLRKAFEQPVLIFNHVSPDGQYVLAWAPLPGNGPAATQAFPLTGGAPMNIVPGSTDTGWAPGGVSWYIEPVFSPGRSFIVPLRPGKALPRIPAGGFHSEDEITAKLPGARRINAARVVPGPSPNVYAFYRGATQRNLYRIPIP